MEERLDAREMMARAGAVAKEIRKSEAYPVIVAGVAGGIAGALMAAIIAGRGSSRRADSEPSAAKESRGGWSAREVMQLVTIAASLARQVQEWLKEKEKA